MKSIRSFLIAGTVAILILFMVAAADKGGFGFPTEKAAAIYGTYTASVYFMSIPGGWIADKLLGLRRAAVVLAEYLDRMLPGGRFRPPELLRRMGRGLLLRRLMMIGDD